MVEGQYNTKMKLYERCRAPYVASTLLTQWNQCPYSCDEWLIHFIQFTLDMLGKVHIREINWNINFTWTRMFIFRQGAFTYPLENIKNVTSKERIYKARYLGTHLSLSLWTIKFVLFENLYCSLFWVDGFFVVTMNLR